MRALTQPSSYATGSWNTDVDKVTHRRYPGSVPDVIAQFKDIARMNNAKVTLLPTGQELQSVFVFMKMVATGDPKLAVQ